VNSFKILRVIFVKNAVTILQNVRAMYVCLYLLIFIWISFKTRNKKRKGTLNIGFKLEIKYITLLNYAREFILISQIDNIQLMDN
jgi:hypothetical protein